MAFKDGTAQGETDSISTQAHHTDTATASRTLLEDAKEFRGGTTPATSRALTDAQRDQVSDLGTSLEKAGLLPSVTLTLAGQEFKNIDGKTDGKRDGTIDMAEVKAAAAAADLLSPGSLESMLYGKLLDQMQKGQIPQEMTQEQLDLKLKSINEGFQKQDKQNGLDVAKLLTETPNLLSLIDAAGGRPDATDPVISKDDIDKYLKRPDVDDKTKSQLDWLSKHWDDTDLAGLKNSEGYLNRQSLNNGIASLEKELTQSRPPAESTAATDPQHAREEARIAKINNTDEAKALKAKGYTLDPSDNGHDEVYRAGDGSVIAIDRNAKGEPIAYTMGDAKSGYRGFKQLQNATGETSWDYYDGTTDGAGGKIVARGTSKSVTMVNGLPKPSDDFRYLGPTAPSA